MSDLSNQIEPMELPQTPIDGMPGRVTWRRLQVFLRDWGYEGPIDGTAGVEVWKAMERFANSIETKGKW